MFTHLVVGANDVAVAKAFCDAALGALGHAPGAEAGDRVVYSAPGGLVDRQQTGRLVYEGSVTCASPLYFTAVIE